VAMSFEKNMFVKDDWTSFENLVQNIRSMVIAHKTCNNTQRTLPNRHSNKKTIQSGFKKESLTMIAMHFKCCVL